MANAARSFALFGTPASLSPAPAWIAGLLAVFIHTVQYHVKVSVSSPAGNYATRSAASQVEPDHSTHPPTL
jgi:hypothetical protein